MLERILKNLKTSLTGVVTAIVTIIGLFGFDIDPIIISSCLSGIILVLGLLAKD